MPARAEIQCIKKTNRYDAHERIHSVGGVQQGQRWKLLQPEAIRLIESGQWEFYVTRGGRTVDVIISMSRYGHKYLKTVADGEQPDNLLSLPECP
jgi:hypothetical protein